VYFTFEPGSIADYPMYPLAPVIGIGGELYGTTVYDNSECSEGGDDGCGTVFAVSAPSK
jgi:hypothetical protein